MPDRTEISMITINQIKQTVSYYFKITEEQLTRKSRFRDAVLPRQVTHYFARELEIDTLKNIGKQIGKKDHATVLHSCKVINNMIETGYKYNGKPVISIINEIEFLLTGDPAQDDECWFLYC